MSAQVTITQLPAAGAITGTEAVPIVQNGQTVQTTTGAIAASPALTATFLTKNQEPTLPNSRYLSTNTGVTLVDGGAQSYYQVALTGAVSELNALGGGIVVKNSASTLINRSIAASGAGLTVSNADGTGGNPTLALSGVAAAVANLSGTGMLAMVSSGTSVAGRDLTGTANQITVTNGNGASGNPTFAIASDAQLPGTGGVVLPKGTSAQQPAGIAGQFRFNTDTQTFDGYASGSWNQFSLVGGVTSFSAGGTGFTPATATGGVVTLGGVLNVTNGGTGTGSLTGYVKGAGTSPMTASATIPTTDLSGTVTNAQLANSAVTVNGTSIALGASGTITSNTTNALTFGTGFSAGSFNGSTATTINLANTAVTAGAYGAASKTLTATVDAQGRLTALADTNIAIANTQVSGLGTMSTQNASAVAVTGGTINGTTVGASTPAAGTFTALATTTGTVSTTPTAATDIANKSYVDGLVTQGISYHEPVYVESPNTAGNLNATYNQPGGAGDGVGATLTNAGTQVALTIDGVLTTVGMRVLIYNQTNQVQNGVYTVTTVGSGSTNWVLTRATDADTYGLRDPNALGYNDAFFVQAGSTGAGETYVVTTTGVIVFGTTAITFAQISSAQIYSAGTGLNLTPATTFNISNTGVTAAAYGSASKTLTATVNAQGQLTLLADTNIAISNAQVSGLGTMSTQNANAVSVTGGTVAGVTLSGSTITSATLGSDLNTAGYNIIGGSYGGNALVLPAGFGPILRGLYEGNAFIQTGTTGAVNRTWTFLDSDGSFTSPGPVAASVFNGAGTGLTGTASSLSIGGTAATASSVTSALTFNSSGTGDASGSTFNGSSAKTLSYNSIGASPTAGNTSLTTLGTVTTGTWNGTAIGVAYGGTGLTATPSNGQLAIGNGTGYSLATLTAGTNVSISNTSGGITISATPAAGGTVQSVDVSGGTTGLTTSGGPVTVTGTITLAGTLVVANGGTGATTLSGYLFGNGTSAVSASTTIPNTAITGLGTMSTQSAGAVAITGGTINGTSIGATTTSTGAFTTLNATTGIFGGTF